ncbi:uncharacterized protein [Physcomitrium patens]|uniref:Methyltransferase type 11 domain-containing protein n=1 Tax=Physcomitrium patens TaxID=3218 RepID=A0A2K1K655_PHYPA|nr:methyltransferase-like protein 13 [Physcomitrium patens]PNR49261.1 hypothetical protein PHYPA_011157 [Physcomitrium patens]|eukprot:XP_024382645.1 methyltransferase-like protein 13 [Physcomitrella patens]
MGRMKGAAEMPGAAGSVPLPEVLTDFRQESYWDQFFKASQGRPFEWYGDWVSLPKVFRELLGLRPERNPPLEILVPGCGNSRLSAAMYDAGFQKIVNVDFNKRVITEMLRLNVRARPLMRWQVMDITKMQFADNSFDVVLDKGSLDALTGEPDEPQVAAEGLLSEVKRVLKHGGKYICITLAQQHVIELLLGNFRIGWDVVVYQVQDESNDTSSALQPLLVVATNTGSVKVSPVKPCLEEVNPRAANADQMNCVVSVIEAENKLRATFEAGSVEDQEVEEDYSEYDELNPGKVRTVKLGGHYLAVVLDAKPESGPHAYKAAVFLVPRGRAHEWLFSTEEGQWEIVEAAKASRLIMVMLDTQQYPGSLAAVQDELSHVVKNFLPLHCKESKDIPYMTTDDGVHRRTVLEEIKSPITGTIKVEDVVLEGKKTSEDAASAPTQSFYRRLVFDRNPNLIQSDAVLVPYSAVAEDPQSRKQTTQQKKKKKKSKAKEPVLDIKNEVEEELRVDHSQLGNSYHAGMIAGVALITQGLEQSLSVKDPVRVMVVGLGAGLLPMFLHNHLPVDHIEVVELDGVIGDLAKRHFGFVENNRMKLHVGDGIDAVHAIGRVAKIPVKVPTVSELSENLATSHINEGSNSVKDQRLHVLIIDADAGDSSLEMSCPPKEFLDESFLAAAKVALVDEGMLVINVVSRAARAVSSAASKLQKVFEEVYELKIDEDVNRVLFALPRKCPVPNDSLISDLRSAALRLRKLCTDFSPWQHGPALEDFLQEDKLRLIPRT